MNELTSIDPVALLAYAEACYEQLDRNYVKFIEILYRIFETQAYKPMYKTMQEYVEARFSRRIRSTQQYLKLGKAYKEAPELKELDFSKARLLVGEIGREDFHESLAYAKTHTVREIQERHAQPGRELGYRISITMYGEKAELAEYMLEDLGPKACGTDDKATIINHAFQESQTQWEQDAGGHEGLEPVTKGTLIRDNWICQGCGAIKHLNRHSHLKAHTGALVSESVVLCQTCHDLYHNEKATIEWFGDGVIRFVRKEG